MFAIPHPRELENGWKAPFYSHTQSVQTNPFKLISLGLFSQVLSSSPPDILDVLFSKLFPLLLNTFRPGFSEIIFTTTS